MSGYIDRVKKNELTWFPEKGFGFYPVHRTHYDDEYFNEYIKMEHTEIGECLNEFRVDLVNNYTKNLVLDIGIGCGAFMRKRGNCLGFDICPKSVELLKEKDLFFNPYNGDFAWLNIRGVTFFDSLEHIEDPGLILKHIGRQFVFISMPIFQDLDHLMASKHLKKDEHFYYFTEWGLIKYMKYQGFRILEKMDDETGCGREDIKSYVFRRAA